MVQSRWYSGDKRRTNAIKTVPREPNEHILPISIVKVSVDRGDQDGKFRFLLEMPPMCPHETSRIKRIVKHFSIRKFNNTVHLTPTKTLRAVTKEALKKRNIRRYFNKTFYFLDYLDVSRKRTSCKQIIQPKLLFFQIH